MAARSDHPVSRALVSAAIWYFFGPAPQIVYTLVIATTVGTYLTLFISLPVAVYAYRVLEPLLGRNRKAVAVEEAKAAADGKVAPTFGVKLSVVTDKKVIDAINTLRTSKGSLVMVSDEFGNVQGPPPSTLRGGIRYGSGILSVAGGIKRAGGRLHGRGAGTRRQQSGTEQQPVKGRYSVNHKIVTCVTIWRKKILRSGFQPRQQLALQGDAQGLAELALVGREALWQLQAIVHAVQRRWPQLGERTTAADAACADWCTACEQGLGGSAASQIGL